VLEILLTGGLHLDGLADTFDGYFSKETSSGKIIEIMKKSNTGVFGVISIVLAILLKIILVYSILTGLGIGTLFNFAGGSLADGSFTDFGPGAIMMFMVLLFTPVFGRLSMNYLFANYEPACKTGSLVLLFKDNSNRASYRMQAFLYSVFYTVAFVAGKYFYLRHINSAVEQNINHRLIYIISIFLIESLFVLFIYSVSVSVTARFFVKKIGGITGDVIGAVSVIAEIYFLFFSLLFLQALRLYSAFLA
jgi:adenosylcobinamide-GDP ribazoletransferase